MKRKHWGDISPVLNEEKLAQTVQDDQKIIYDKRSELKILHSSVFLEDKHRNVSLVHRNSSVNAIVGIKQKQELIQELIDASQYNTSSFQQMLPTLRETLPVLSQNFSIPRLNCFITSSKSDFIAGKPKQVPKINKTCVEQALKKSICGLVRITDFTDIQTSALTLLADSVDHFYKSMMEAVVNILANENLEAETDVDILTFEKSYFQLTNETSSVLLLKYANSIYSKHQQTLTEFSEKVGQLKNIVETSNHSEGGIYNEMSSSDFSSHFIVKQEDIKQEIDDF
jgi:hypothetical protein